MADEPSPPSGSASTRRVELVQQSGDDQNEARLTGVGLLSGLFLGRGSLQAAASGSEAFASALAHFVVVVLACVAGALVLGRIYASVTTPAPSPSPTSAGNPDGDPTLDPALNPSLNPSLNPHLGDGSHESTALNESPESPISPHVAD